GTWCEPLVADLYVEATGNRVHRYNRMMRSEEHPFMLADIDRKLYGKNEGLECKTIGEFAARMRVKDPETEEVHWIPRFVPDDMETSLSRKPEWYCQMQHYMAVTGWQMWHLAVLIGNHDFLWFDVPRDDPWIAEMVKQEAAFWDCVVRRDNIWKE
ncbi:MAG: YqaJ viral recombinase family protein, partial [Clostridia bacterium]|nr:YqaJ viral recombinase family protein [Clostridia bacterium]